MLPVGRLKSYDPAVLLVDTWFRPPAASPGRHGHHRPAHKLLSPLRRVEPVLCAIVSVIDTSFLAAAPDRGCPSNRAKPPCQCCGCTGGGLLTSGRCYSS